MFGTQHNRIPRNHSVYTVRIRVRDPYVTQLYKLTSNTFGEQWRSKWGGGGGVMPTNPGNKLDGGERRTNNWLPN